MAAAVAAVGWDGVGWDGMLMNQCIIYEKLKSVARWISME